MPASLHLIMTAANTECSSQQRSKISKRIWASSKQQAASGEQQHGWQQEEKPSRSSKAEDFA
jgi:hypothetical protein